MQEAGRVTVAPPVRRFPRKALLAALLALPILSLPPAAVADPQPSPAYAPLDGLWRVTVGPSRLTDNCVIERHSFATINEPAQVGGLRFWQYYETFDFDGRQISAQAPVHFADSGQWGGEQPPQAVVEALRAKNLTSTLSAVLTASGERISGVDQEYCVHWRGDELLRQEVMQIPFSAQKVAVTLRALDAEGQAISEVLQGQTFVLEVALSRSINWNNYWLQRAGVESVQWVEVKAVEGDGLRMRTGELTVLAPTGDADLDLYSEAEAGRFYAAAGEVMTFTLGRRLATVDLLVRSTAGATLQPPKIDELELEVARASLDADIDKARRDIAFQREQIARQDAALEALAESARTKDAAILALETQMLTLTQQRDALAIDRAALPAELRTLLGHRDNLIREKRLSEDRLLAAQDRGDTVSRDFEVKTLDSLERQLKEVNRRIRALWAGVPESADDSKPTTPAQLERVRRELQAELDRLRGDLVEARARRGFDDSSTAVAREAIADAEAEIVRLEARLGELETARRRLDRPFGYVQYIDARQSDFIRYEATHDDLQRLQATFDDVKNRLAEAKRTLHEAERLHWRLKNEFLQAAQRVSDADWELLDANWSSLAQQLGVEVLAQGGELGFAFVTGGPPGLLVEATSKLAFNLWDLYRGQEDVKSFDPSRIAAVVAKQRENEEKRYDADAALDDDFCRYAAAAGAEAQRLAVLEPDLFPPGSLYDRYGWPVLRETLSMALKNPATYAGQRAQLQQKMARDLAQLEELRRIRANPNSWMDAMDPRWRDKVDVDALLDAERRALQGAAEDLSRLSSWRRQAAQAGLGFLVSAAINVGKQKAQEWIRSNEGEAYVAFFEKQMAMTQAWRAFMGSSCLRWNEHDRVERLQQHYDALLKAYDLELGFVVATNKPIDLAAELIVSVPVSSSGYYPMELEIAGVKGERMDRSFRFRFPAGSLAQAPTDRPLAVVVKVKPPE